jgi:hypothetical protein
LPAKALVGTNVAVVVATIVAAMRLPTIALPILLCIVMPSLKV